ncbi:MAG: NUDIX hydrolase [Candidatus Eisenbacteria bacterium]|nr:NUDIX hydrolase [Candidatus Eisenbacteria bacterium]
MERKSPRVTADIIIVLEGGKVLLIRRRNPPYGWALPGGFLEYGETLEECARREAFEETGLELRGLRQFGTYSDPGRDPRGHTVSTVFVAEAQGKAAAGDDAADIGTFYLDSLPDDIAFDHRKILDDFKAGSQGNPAGGPDDIR